MQLEASFEIRAPAAAVFDVVSTPERLPQWNRSVAEARRLGAGPVELGARATMVGQLLGRPMTSETEVVGFEPPRWFETRAVRGPRLLTTFRLEPVPFGTRLSITVSGDVPGGRVGGFVAERLLRAQLADSLRQLAAVCEGEARQAAAREALAGGDPACWRHLHPTLDALADGDVMPSGTPAREGGEADSG